MLDHRTFEANDIAGANVRSALGCADQPDEDPIIVRCSDPESLVCGDRNDLDFGGRNGVAGVASDLSVIFDR